MLEGAAEAGPGHPLPALAGHLQLDLHGTRRRQLEQVVGTSRAETLGGRRERDARRPPHVIQAVVCQEDLPTLHGRLEHRPARRPFEPANLKDVGVVGAEPDGQRQGYRPLAEVADLDLLVACTVPEHLGP